MLKLTDSFKKLQNWILDSGLVIVDKNNENFGGVHSFFDEENHEFGFIYPEITGYFLSTLRFLSNLDNKNNLSEIGKNSADWLTKIYEKYGGIIQGISTDGTPNNLVYTFDTGICAKGLLDYYLISKDQTYLNLATKLMDWIIRDALEKDGTVKPFYDLQKNSFEENDKVWYKQKGCLHIKLAIPFYHLANITKKSIYKESAILISNSFENFKKEDGSLSLHQNEKIIHIHSLCYALEGLYYTYFHSHDEKYLECCENALDWCAKQIQKDGSINLWFNSKFTQAKTSYHVAQLLRLMILSDKLSGNSKFHDFSKMLFSYLQTFQANSKIPQVNGGYYEEFYKSFLGWKLRKRLNSWGSMFAIQALYWNSNSNLKSDDCINFLY